MQGIHLEGRLDQRFYLERNWLFDVAHNYDSARILGDFLSKQNSEDVYLFLALCQIRIFIRSLMSCRICNTLVYSKT